MGFDENDWLSLCCALKDNASLGSIKLLIRSLRIGGHREFLPINIACEFSSAKVVKYLVEELDREYIGGNVLEYLIEQVYKNDSILHYSCRGGNLEIVKYLLERHASLISLVKVNEKGELPIHLLCEAGKVKIDCDSVEYIETIWRMLLANPEALMGT